MKAVEGTKSFVGEVKQELAKCSKPSRDELMGSTLVIIITMAAVGIYSFVIDLGFHAIIQWMVRR
ncbi:MAG: preprotein translocase subunit SecE [Verrucomicrobiae bacterium]|nr:preprotein translocase subunit SecE [Verrucomicrobiae bacterium]